MRTNYDVGQTVLLMAEVVDIIINKDGVTYSLILPGKKNAIKVPENKIAFAVASTTETEDGQ